MDCSHQNSSLAQVTQHPTTASKKGKHGRNRPVGAPFPTFVPCEKTLVLIPRTVQIQSAPAPKTRESAPAGSQRTHPREVSDAPVTGGLASCQHPLARLGGSCPLSSPRGTPPFHVFLGLSSMEAKQPSVSPTLLPVLPRALKAFPSTCFGLLGEPDPFLLLPHTFTDNTQPTAFCWASYSGSSARSQALGGEGTVM